MQLPVAEQDRNLVCVAGVKMVAGLGAGVGDRVRPQEGVEGAEDSRRAVRSEPAQTTAQMSGRRRSSRLFALPSQTRSPMTANVVVARPVRTTGIAMARVKRAPHAGPRERLVPPPGTKRHALWQDQ